MLGKFWLGGLWRLFSTLWTVNSVSGLCRAGVSVSLGLCCVEARVCVLFRPVSMRVSCILGGRGRTWAAVLLGIPFDARGACLFCGMGAVSRVCALGPGRARCFLLSVTSCPAAPLLGWWDQFLCASRRPSAAPRRQVRGVLLAPLRQGDANVPCGARLGVKTSRRVLWA